jgi:hypothetical protein
MRKVTRGMILPVSEGYDRHIVLTDGIMHVRGVPPNRQNSPVGTIQDDAGGGTSCFLSC